MEEVVLHQSQTDELRVNFEGGCPPRAGRVRRFPLSARKIESAAIRFPANRARLKTTKKEHFYFMRYSGVC